MPERVPERPRGPAAAVAEVAAPAALREVHGSITAMSEAMGLLRYGPEERARIGMSGHGLRLQKSLACLRFLRKRPDIAARLRLGSPEAWDRVVDLRLSIQQARTALQPTIQAAERGALCLLGEITSLCDQIEDHVGALYAREGATAEERMRLRAKFEVPARVRQFYEETLEERRTRRARRRAVRAGEIRERAERLERAAAFGALRREALAEETGGER